MLMKHIHEVWRRETCDNGRCHSYDTGRTFTAIDCRKLAKKVTVTQIAEDNLPSCRWNDDAQMPAWNEINVSSSCLVIEYPRAGIDIPPYARAIEFCNRLRGKAAEHRDCRKTFSADHVIFHVANRKFGRLP